MPEDAIDTTTESEHLELDDIYLTGKLFTYLITGSGNKYPFAVLDNDERYILEALEELCTILKKSEVSSGVYNDIRQEKNRLIETYPTDLSELESDLDEDDDDEFEPPHTVELSTDDYRSLHESAERWQSIVRTEINNLSFITIEEQGLLDKEEAMENPEKLFYKTTVWEQLPSQTKSDLSEACRTLALNCSTSAVFLSLRAVEERLQEWYNEETGNDIGTRTFGQVLSEIDDQYTESDRPTILSHLNYLKDRRNQIAHPERSPQQQEAESTLVMVRETITHIHAQIYD